MGFHFTLVLVPAETTDIQRKVEEMMAPYDPDAAEYMVECGCAESGGPDPECDLCGGSGKYNPNSNFDYCGIKGRWGADGRFSWQGQRGKNPIPVTEIDVEKLDCFALVTPDGEWHARGWSEWGAAPSEGLGPEWLAEVRALLKAHDNCLAVAVYCHA